MRLLARIGFALAGALLFSQSAEFTQQYLQRLGGAADELRAVVRRFDESATAESLTRGEAAARLKASPDRLVSRQGLDAETSAARFEETERRYRDLVRSAPLLRPFSAAGDLDGDIAARTLEDFRPALPVTPDGFALTCLGFLLGWGAGSGMAGLGRRIGRTAST